MNKNYELIRYFLFSNSYSGQKIRTQLTKEYCDKNVAKVVKRLSNVLSFKYGQLLKFVAFGIKPKSPYQRFPARLRIYLEIEKELAKLTEEKSDKYSTAVEDYQRQLLYPAIERAAGNSLINISSDRKFQKNIEEKIREYTSTYYKVAYEYKLPTMRIVPFIIRLIS